MASIIETTAISLRKGNTEANLSFCGILGECVADLGIDGTGTDPNTTLRLHNAVITGGIPMCRADLLNISTSQLAVGRDLLGMANEKNLAYADLSNLEASEDISTKNKIVQTFSNYGLATEEDTDTKLATKANKNFSNIDTIDLATGEGETGKHSGKNLAYADGSNINTAGLVDTTLHNNSPVGNKPLAYADTTNINTANLVDSSIHNNEPAGNKALMYADMTNVLSNDLYIALFETHNDALHIEQTTNKLTSYFDPSTGQLLPDISANAYPNANAVMTYTQWAIENGSFMQTDISNATDYDALYSNSGVTLNIPKDDQGQDEYTLHPNRSGPYKYIVGSEGVKINGEGFKKDHLYTNFVAVSITTIYESGNYNQKDLLKVYIEEVDSDTNLPTSVTFWQNYGVESLSGITSVTISDGAGTTVTIPLTVSSVSGQSGFYKYTAGTPSTTATSGNFSTGVINIDQNIELNQLFWVHILETDEDDPNVQNPVGAITKCEFLPKTSAHFVDVSDQAVAAKFDPVLVESGISGKPGASIDFLCKTYVSNLGGAGVAKTDLSNLLGMTDEEAEKATGTPWKAVIYDEIPSVNATDIPAIQYTELASNGTVWDALTDAYQKTMGAAAGRDSVTGNLIDVASYVKTTLDQYALSDTYRGQVLYYLPNETNIGIYVTRPNSSTPIQTGDQILLKQKSDVLGGRPYLATATNTSGTITWTYEPFVNQSSAQSNGDYVYCLDLGTWDPEQNYRNASGNITWNANAQPPRLDIAPDHDNVPDGLTIVKDSTTGKLRIGDYFVPAPEYFTGAATDTQVITLANNTSGIVPFDLYVSGVFQYPNTYIYNPSTKQITLNFKVEPIQNNIVVIYRGIVFNSTYYTLTVNPFPEDATVILDGMERTSITVPADQSVTWIVAKQGYTTQIGNELMTSSHALTVTLAPAPVVDTYTLTINPTPNDATVILNGEERTSITVESGTAVHWSVSRNGYTERTGVETMTEDKNLDIDLVKASYTFTINPTPADATVTINGEERTSVTAVSGSALVWSVEKAEYRSQSGTEVLNDNTTLSITLVPATWEEIDEPTDYTYNIDSEGTLTLDEYNGTDTDVTTPHL